MTRYFFTNIIVVYQIVKNSQFGGDAMFCYVVVEPYSIRKANIMSIYEILMVIINITSLVLTFFNKKNNNWFTLASSEVV